MKTIYTFQKVVLHLFDNAIQRITFLLQKLMAAAANTIFLHLCHVPYKHFRNKQEPLK